MLRPCGDNATVRHGFIKVGSSSLTSPGNPFRESGLLKRLEHYARTTHQENMTLDGLIFLYLTKSAARAHNLQHFVHTTMRVEHPEMLVSGIAFGNQSELS